MSHFHAYLFLVSNLPEMLHSNFYGAKALTSVALNGVYLQHDEIIYELSFDTNTCFWKWTILKQELTNGVYGSVFMYLPPGYNCTSTP